MSLFETLWSGVTLLLALPVVVVFVQVLAGGRLPRAVAPSSGPRPRLAVLVPAHNESVGVAETVRSILAQLHLNDRLLVVADNCSDDTAQCAALAGAEVVERHDDERRGKGFALDFGVRHLAADPPEVLVMVDADCLLGPGALQTISVDCATSGRPIQALYLMRTGRDASVRARIAEFAWLVRNQARPLGAWRLGGPCQLMGTGMAFPWALIHDVPLASGHLVEDMKLGIDLARQGRAPRFSPTALVHSRFPAEDGAAKGQRTRWEHGHLATLLEAGPPLLGSGLLRGDMQSVALALDLMVPPLALLVMLQAGLALLNLVFWGVWSWEVPLAIGVAAMVLTGAAIGIAWGLHGRHVIRVRELAFAPLYALWKLPVYGAFLLRRQVEWIRAKRDGE
jgi:cellulose synthase/poly-beta-1,6-N-acetylglucosamine synthase-like glycosyltransferase